MFRVGLKISFSKKKCKNVGFRGGKNMLIASCVCVHVCSYMCICLSHEYMYVPFT